MAKSVLAWIEPAVLAWARKSVNLTPLAAARKLGVDEARLLTWETGEDLPTVAKLADIAKLYRRPMAVFYMPEPPRDFDTIRDFRRVPGAAEGSMSLELHGEYWRALDQRDVALELGEIEDTTPSTTWRLDPVPADDLQLAGAARSLLLEVGPLPLSGRSTDRYLHLNHWSAALEAAGVLVMATSGGKISTKEMRGLSLYFDALPVVMLNGSDAPRGRLFSLIHEYAHLLLRTDGLCDVTSDPSSTRLNRQVETRCNMIAAELLMPTDTVLNLAVVRSRVDDESAWSHEDLREGASWFGVSAEAFLRRLRTLQRVGEAVFDARMAEIEEIARQAEEAKAAAPRKKGKGDGNFYRTKARDLGKGFVRGVASAHRRRVIDSYTAANFLDVKVGQIERLAEMAELSESA